MTVSMRKYEKTLGWIFLALMPYVLPQLIVYLCQLLDLQMDNAKLNILVFSVNFALTILIFHRFLWENAKQSFSRPGKTFLWLGISFAAYNLGTNLTMMLVTLLAPGFSNANDASIAEMLQGNFLPMALCIIVLVPVTEEVLYRGLLFGSLRKKCRWLAYVVSICVFSALHIINYIGMLSPLHLVVSFLQYLPGAAALAFAYDMSDSIWPGILIHSTINMLATLSMQFLR